MNEGMKSCDKPSRGRYVQGCRCYMCRVANADYSRAHDRGENEKKMVGRASVKRAQARVRKWLDAGVPLRTISRVTGIGRSTINVLLGNYASTNSALYKNGSLKPLKRMSYKNYKAIMDKNIQFEMADGSLISADKSIQIIKVLREQHGLSMRDIEKYSGVGYQCIRNLSKLDASSGHEIRKYTAQKLSEFARRFAANGCSLPKLIPDAKLVEKRGSHYEIDEHGDFVEVEN